MDFEKTFGKVTPPKELQPLINQGGDDSGKAIGAFLNNVINLIFVFAVFIFLFMIVQAAINWIMSGGDKEAIGKARSRIINAIIGLIILATAYFFTNFVGQVLGFKWFK